MQVSAMWSKEGLGNTDLRRHINLAVQVIHKPALRRERAYGHNTLQ